MKRGHQWNLQPVLPRCALQDLSILRGGAGRGSLFFRAGQGGAGQGGATIPVRNVSKWVRQSENRFNQEFSKSICLKYIFLVKYCCCREWEQIEAPQNSFISDQREWRKFNLDRTIQIELLEILLSFSASQISFFISPLIIPFKFPQKKESFSIAEITEIN